MSPVLWEFSFSPTTAPPPTGNQLRFDVLPPYHNITRVWVRFITNDGIDVYHSLLNITTGRLLWVQDKDDHLKFVKLRATGQAVDAGGYCEIPVAWVETGLPLTGQAVALVIADEAVAPIPPGPPSTPRTLETLANAKLQLGITDPAHDDQVQLMLEHASALILDYIGVRADPSWDETTAPDVVQAATLKMLSHLYEHRGDDASEEHDEKIWEAISLLLMRTRDPALA